MKRITPALILCLLLSACAPAPPTAYVAAQVSYVTYETLAPACESATMDLILLKRMRPFTPSEQGRYDQLKGLGKVLEEYRLAHRIYIQTLLPMDRAALSALIDRSIDLGHALLLNFTERRLSP